MAGHPWDREVAGYGKPGAIKRDQPPDGQYQGVIERMIYEQNPGKDPKLVWVLKILNGPQKDRKFFHRRLLSDPTWRERAWQDLVLTGLDPRSWGDALDRLGEIEGNAVDFKLKTSQKGFQNCYFDAPESAGGPRYTGGEPRSKDEEIPF